MTRTRDVLRRAARRFCESACAPMSRGRAPLGAHRSNATAEIIQRYQCIAARVPWCPGCGCESCIERCRQRPMPTPRRKRDIKPVRALELLDGCGADGCRKASCARTASRSATWSSLCAPGCDCDCGVRGRGLAQDRDCDVVDHGRGAASSGKNLTRQQKGKCNALFVGRLLSRDCSLCRREPRSSTTELCLLLQSSRRRRRGVLG